MMYKYLSVIISTLILLFSCTQTITKAPIDISPQVVHLKTLLTKAESASPEETYNDTADLNDQIAEELEAILTQPEIVSYDLGSLLKHPFLKITHSLDKRFWDFCWYSNNGGTWTMYSNVLHYRTKSNVPKFHKDFEIEDNADSYCASLSEFDTIYKLSSSEGKDIYLCLNSAGVCSSCCSKIATVFELRTDDINLNYPAFLDVDKNWTACYTLGSRCGDILKFEYNPAKETISYSYKVDDNTPYSSSDYPAGKIISGLLKWNGKSFEETIFGNKN